MNSTIPGLYDYPFYHSQRSSLLPRLSDHALSLVAPVIAYWVLSLLFHLLDLSNSRTLDKYRIHAPHEAEIRNRASPTQVAAAVILQQAIQTGLGFVWIDESNRNPIDHHTQLQGMVHTLSSVSMAHLGESATAMLIGNVGKLAWYTYWWAIPTLQFFFAMFIIDTWQYFLHRLFHVNSFLYKHFHSVHHRLYVPYAFGALYNHPVEGFILDSLGAVIAHSVSFMTTRQAILLFTVSTLKTVDDHCGYRLPFDPLQLFSGNTADYHDIHHQAIGIKHNFSQPFFIHWDVILGTRMTRQDVDRRRKAMREKMT